VPGLYPLPANSHVLRNDTERGNCRFTDVTKEVAPSLTKIGLVTSALWSDYDNDGWTDLIIAGEFMPITIYHNDQGKQFTVVRDEELQQSSGWWNSLVAGDFDNDGDTDYVGGNLGLNTRYLASQNEPLCIYAKDFDKNGSIDPIMSYYLNDEKHILHFRDEMISQISAIRARFRNYKDYAEANFENSFLPSELKNAYNVCSEKFETSYIENLGNGEFAIKSLPLEAQFAPVYGMITGDYNDDGYLDLLLVGNSYSTEVNTGQYDASAGLYLKGDGQGNFVSVTPANSGFIADGEGKSLLQLSLKDGAQLILAGNTSGPLKAYRDTRAGLCYRAQPQDAYAIVTLKNGKTFKHEFYYGSTYLSQSSRSLRYTSDVKNLTVVDFKGAERALSSSPETIVKSK